MATLPEHIERLRAQPEHVRHRVALGIATAITALVAVTWAGTLATSGRLALKDTGAIAPEELTASVSESASTFSNLMSAAGAALNATSSDAVLRIVETKTSSTIETQPASANNTNQTVIPF